MVLPHKLREPFQAVENFVAAPFVYDIFLFHFFHAPYGFIGAMLVTENQNSKPLRSRNSAVGIFSTRTHGTQYNTVQRFSNTA